MTISNFKRAHCCILFFMVLAFFAGFRWDVGIDWMSYYESFGSDINGNGNPLKLEPINLGMNILLRSFGYFDSRYWIWIMAIITLFFTSKSIYLYSSSPVKSFVLFILMGFFFDSLNTVRQFCAVAIALYSWQYIIAGNFKSFAKWLVVAVLLHSSAVVVLPAYFLIKYPIKRKYLKFLIISGIFLSPISTKVAQFVVLHLPFKTAYADSDFIKYAVGSGNIFSYIRMLFPLFMLVYLKSIWNKIAKDKFSNFILSMSTVGMWLQIAFPTSQLVIRISYYYEIAMIILIPLILRCKDIKLINRKLLWALTIVYFSLFLFITYLSRPVAKIIPYTMKFDLMNGKLFVLLGLVIVLLILFSKSARYLNYYKQY